MWPLPICSPAWWLGNVPRQWDRPSLCLLALDLVADDGSQVVGWGREELACVPAERNPPNSQNFVPPVFPPVCPSHAAATTSICDGGPPPTTTN